MDLLRGAGAAVDAGDRDHRDAGRPERAEHLAPADVGERQVDQGGVEAPAGDGGERLLAVGAGEGLGAEARGGVRHERRDLGVLVDDQDPLPCEKSFHRAPNLSRARVARGRAAAVPSEGDRGSFHHLAIQCVDLARCERFYPRCWGCACSGAGRARTAGRGTGASGSPWVTARWRPSSRWSGPTAPLMGGRGVTAPPGLHLAALRIPAWERRMWEERLAAAGVEVVHRSRWTLYVRDPEGNRIGLSHHPRSA